MLAVPLVDEGLDSYNECTAGSIGILVRTGESVFAFGFFYGYIGECNPYILLHMI